MRRAILIGILLTGLLSTATGKSSITDARVLRDDTRFTILGPGESRVERSYKVLVLTARGGEYANVMLFYDKFRKIASLKATVTDLGGKVIKRYGTGDGRDYRYGGEELATDMRVKRWKMGPDRYPYIIEVAYREEYKGSLFYPRWDPVPGERQAMESATLTVCDPLNLGVRYKGLNVADPVKAPEGRGWRYTWSVRGIPPRIAGPFDAPWASLPVVYLAPVGFEMEGLKGNMETWEAFGQWIDRLMQGRDELPPEGIARARQLCEGIASPREKARAIYRHVQQTTRYVSVQLGIGGWQPFPARFVDQKRYGDCKALSCYTRALLQAVGIPSYYTLIRAGREAEPLLTDFPSAHFNHVIVTVPLEGDTLWLECTSRVAPLGFRGSFISGRHALMITPEGGRLTRVRDYTGEENVTVTRVSLDIVPGGDVRLGLDRELAGVELEEGHFLAMLERSETERRSWVMDAAHYGNLELQSFRFKPLEGDECPRSGYEVEGLLKGFCPTNGDRLFLTPFVFTTLRDVRFAESDDHVPVEIRYPCTRIDTIAVRLPENSVMESMPGAVALKMAPGEYSIHCYRQGDVCYFVRRFTLHAGRYPAGYGDLKSFFRQVQLHDLSRVVIHRKKDHNG
ncbi:MAG: DUF3857 and transglutaminase domain-containing protein [Odoribacteraceae bacterium]|jgi:hypothetical protein|nr:DUF3857 and transglutaminase domain-containing protein [Odoribacteraceae bacterium]